LVLHFPVLHFSQPLYTTLRNFNLYLIPDFCLTFWS